MVKLAVLLLVGGCAIGPSIYVEPDGDGAGEITSVPEGIHCGTDCAMVVDDRIITLFARPKPGSRFAGWDVGGCEGDTCRLQLTGDRHVKPRFVRDTQPISVSLTGSGRGRVLAKSGGIDCGLVASVCEAAYPTGHTVILEARADIDSVFVGWSGACSGEGTCEIVVDAPAHAIAQFAAFARLTVTKAGGGIVSSQPAGISCGGMCSSIFPLDTQVTLVAIPDPGYRVRWGGACSGEPCVVTIADDTQVSATFVQDATLSVVRIGDGDGTVTGPGITCGATCATTVESGTVVTLTAQAQPGSTFVGWSGGGCSGTGACVSTIQTSTTIQARFDGPPPPCTATVTQNESASAFNARLGVPDVVVCLADGVVIDGLVTVGADGITIRAEPPTAHATVRTTGDTAIQINGKQDVVLRDLEIRARKWVVWLDAGASGELDGVHVECETNFCIAVNVTHATISVRDSTLIGMGPGGWALWSEAMSSIDIVNSTLAGGPGVYLVSTQGTIRQSTLTSVSLVLEVQSSNIVVANSTLDTSSGAIRFGGPSLATLTLDGNMVRKRAGTTSSESPIQIDGSGHVLHSTAPNTFCNEGTSTSDGQFVAPLVMGAIGATSTFQNVGHVGPIDCP